MAQQTSATTEEIDVQDPQSHEIDDQATLDAAIEAETAKMSQTEVTEEKPVVAKETQVEPEAIDYKQKFIEIKKGFDKIALEKKQLEAQRKLEEETLAFQQMDYDQKLQHVLTQNSELKQSLEVLQGGLQEYEVQQAAKADKNALDTFVTSDPELSISPQLQDMFRSLAQSDDFVPAQYAGDKEVRWREVPFEDIKQVYFKPLLEKLSGTRVRTKERVLVGKPQAAASGEFTQEQIAKMSLSEYETNMPKIMKQFGIRI